MWAKRRIFSDKPGATCSYRTDLERQTKFVDINTFCPQAPEFMLAVLMIFPFHDFPFPLIIYLLTAAKRVMTILYLQETKQFYCASMHRVYPGGLAILFKPPATSLRGAC